MSTFMEKQKERLRLLSQKRNEAQHANHKEVLLEDARNHLPANYEARKRRAEWILQDTAERKAAAEKGQDYDRTKLLNISALEAEAQRIKKSKKSTKDVGFSDYEASTVRQYQRLIRNMPAKDVDHYNEEKERYGEAFYPSRTIIHGMHTDRPQAIDKMVNDLNEQVAKREKYSRRRTHNDDADIDYINERNKRFNRKLEQFYGEYTQEIKQNLERGTAV